MRDQTVPVLWCRNVVWAAPACRPWPARHPHSACHLNWWAAVRIWQRMAWLTSAHSLSSARCYLMSWSLCLPLTFSPSHTTTHSLYTLSRKLYLKITSNLQRLQYTTNPSAMNNLTNSTHIGSLFSLPPQYWDVEHSIYSMPSAAFLTTACSNNPELCDESYLLTTPTGTYRNRN